MALIFLFLVGGMLVGFLLRRQTPILSLAQKATNVFIFALIFFLGASVGLNRVVMASLNNLGWQALVLSLGSILGSVLASGFIYFYYFRGLYEK